MSALLHYQLLSLLTACDSSNPCCCRAASQSASNLVYPNVDVDLSAIDSALAQHIPSLEVQSRLRGTLAVDRRGLPVGQHHSTTNAAALYALMFGHQNTMLAGAVAWCRDRERQQPRSGRRPSPWLVAAACGPPHSCQARGASQVCMFL
jgi:hypothetical protein